MSDPVCHVLWFRQCRREKWRPVFVGLTSQDCTDAMAHGLGLRHGEWYTVRGTKKPRGANHTAPRRAKT